MSRAASVALLDSRSFTLANGLKVIVQEDRKAPLVTVQVMYRVGSLDEPEGHHGYAHLFEHLMFEGSKNYDFSYFDAFRAMGATEYNGVTNLDRTVYYETVPRAALERALFLESDRMGFLLDALTQRKLDNQVAVVLNEKRQGEDRPYGTVWTPIFEDLYPVGHPYRHSTIGLEKDLRAATLDDVRAWFRRYYGAANATLILTGDIGEQEARQLAETYFGGIAPGPARARPVADAPPMAAPVRRFMEARVAVPRLYRHYIAPPMGTGDDAAVELMIQILGNGLVSRLRHRLVDELGIATASTITFGENQLSGQIGVIVDAVSVDRLPEIGREVDAVLARFMADGATAEEMARARTVRLATLSRFLESSFGKSVILTRGELFTGQPDYYATDHLRRLRDATGVDVRRVARSVFRHGYSEMVVLPMPDRGTGAATPDRSAGPPPIGTSAAVRFPAVREARLANGIRVVYAARPAGAPVEIVAQIDAGAATDMATPGGRPGWRTAAMALLDRGAGTRDATAMARAQEDIGGSLLASTLLDVARIRLSMFAERLDAGMALLADTIIRPRYAPDEVARYRTQRLAALDGERTTLGAAAIRVVRQTLYGPDHPYGARPIAVDAATVRALTASDLHRWHDRWMRPERMTLFVAAGVPLEELMPVLDRTLGGWRPAGAPAAIPVAAPAPATLPSSGDRIILVDVPGTQQAMVMAARLMPPTGDAGDTATMAANEIFGGNPSARINTVLRSQKGWSYGIGSGASDARGPRLMVVAGPVEKDRAGDTVTELRAQMRAIGGDRSPSAPELAQIAEAEAGKAAGKVETTADIATALADNAIYGRPFDYGVTTAQRYRTLTTDALKDAARRTFDPSAMLWVVAGDAAVLRPQLAAIAGGRLEFRRSGE